MHDGHKEAGRIDYVKAGKEDHGILTVWAGIDFGGGAQGFGGLCLETKTSRAFLRELCETFDVSDHEALVGKKCHALRCFGTNNDPIEGLEAPSGKRFTLTGFRKRHYPEHAKSRLEEEKERLQREMAWAGRRRDEAADRLATVGEQFVDWER